VPDIIFQERKLEKREEERKDFLLEKKKKNMNPSG